MTWTEFLMLLINGGILIVFRCWVESKWKRRERQKERQTHSKRP
ncbi:Trp-rich small protein [Staphylococcus lutrae]